MYVQVGKPKENKSRAVANAVAQKKNVEEQGVGFVDNRETSVNHYLVRHSGVGVASEGGVVQAVFNYDGEYLEGEWRDYLKVGQDVNIYEEVKKRHALMWGNDTDINIIYEAIKTKVPSIKKQDVQNIKKYNFDSQGVLFTVENYDAWKRTAEGHGKVDDLRYLFHEFVELKVLASQKGGLSFMEEEEKWDDDKSEGFSARYDRAHGVAIMNELINLANEYNRRYKTREITWEDVAVISAKQDYHEAWARVRFNMKKENWGEDHLDDYWKQVNAYLEVYRRGKKDKVEMQEQLGQMLEQPL